MVRLWILAGIRALEAKNLGRQTHTTTTTTTTPFCEVSLANTSANLMCRLGHQVVKSQRVDKFSTIVVWQNIFANVHDAQGMLAAAMLLEDTGKQGAFCTVTSVAGCHPSPLEIPPPGALTSQGL